MCKHYWLIDGRNQGVCKLCSKTKDFQTALSKATRANDRISPFEKRIINNFSVARDYYWPGHIANSGRKRLE